MPCTILGMSDIATEEIRANKYVLYARKSADDSEKQVRSIPDQIKECEDYAERLGLNVVKPYIIDDGKSAKKPNRRPNFNALIQRIEKGEVDGILAWHPDRLARNMMEGGQIIQLLDDAKLTDLKFSSFPFTNDASGKMMLGIAFALSKHYSEKLSTDVKRGLLHGLKEGKSAGQYKPGYNRDSKTGLYHRDETNFPIVEEAWAMKLARTPEQKIVEMMNAKGYRRIIKKEKTKLKKEQIMSVQKLNDMFRDPIYYGVLLQKNREVNLSDLYEFESMITKAEFDMVQNMRRGGKEKVKYDLPLRGLVLCNQCKEPRVAAPSTSRNKKDRFIYFRCDTPGCKEKGKSVRALVVLEAIANALKNISTDGVDHREIEEFLNSYTKNAQKDSAAELKRLKRDRTKAETELNEMAVRKAKVSFDKDELAAYEQEKERLRGIVSRNDARIDELSVQSVFSAVDVEQFLNTLKTAAEDYELMDHIHKDIIARMLILNITAEKGIVSSVTLNPPFDELIKRPVFNDGGPGGI